MRSVIRIFILQILTISCIQGQLSYDSSLSSLYPSDYTASEINQQVLADSLWIWQEQVQLHTDNDQVRAGETLFFKADILTGPNRLRVSASEVLQVELLNKEGKLLKKQVHRISKGSSSGSLDIPGKTEPGIYFFRAYTRWMLNYGIDALPTREILIKDRRDKSVDLTLEQDIAIEPEGGVLVDGLMSNVVVFSRTQDLDGIPVVNEKGEVLARIEGYGRNLGSFHLRPKRGDRYFLQFTEKERLALPEVADLGYSLQVNNLQPEKILIRIEVTETLRRNRVYLQGVYDGIRYVDKVIDFDDGNVASFEIPRAGIPDGLLNLLIADESGQVWAYRPVLVETNELQILAEKQTGPGGSEFIKLRISDRDQNPVATSLSVGLSGEFRKEAIEVSAATTNKSQEQGRNTAFIKDLKVLAGKHGNQPKIYQRTRVPEGIRFAFQKGLDFIGQAYNLNNELLVSTDIQILIENGDRVDVSEVRTDGDGMFRLTGLDLTGDATLIFRTAGAESAAKLVKVIPYEYETPPLVIPEYNKKSLKVTGVPYPSTAEKFLSSQTLKEEKDRTIALETVTVVATRELSKSNIPDFALVASKVIDQDPERPRPIDQLFLNIPGIQVVGLGSPYPYLSIPRAAQLGPLLWVLDGFLLGQNTTLVDIISLVPFTDVERIEILIGGEASFYGTRSAGGVISIKTRSGADIDYLARKDAQAELQGFHESIGFNEVEMEGRGKKKRSPYNTTIFWDPELRTDQNGEVIIPVPMTTDLDQIRLEARVFTQDGRQGLIEVFFDKIN